MKACPHCLSPLDESPKGAPRSPEQLRRYFAMLRAVHFHWPDTAEHKFDDVTALRKWAQMKAGHREIGARIPLTGVSKEAAMFLAEAAIRGSGSHALPIIHGDTMVVFVPKSIAFSKLGHRDFCKLNDEVDQVIRDESGLDPEKCMAEYKAIV